MVEEEKTRGVIYILTNPDFKEYIKIGYADNMERRLSELNRSTAIQYTFIICATCQTTRKLSDVAVHELIDLLDPDLRTVEEFNGKKETTRVLCYVARRCLPIITMYCPNKWNREST